MPEAVLTADDSVEKAANFVSSIKQEQVRKVLEARDTPATILFIICIDHFGSEFTQWEPETLAMELQSEFNAKLPQVNLDKIWAVSTFMTTDKFFKDVNIFISICNALSDSEVDFQTFDPASVDEMAWAVTELYTLEAFKPEQFSDELRSYAGTRLVYEGLVRPPKMLGWAVMPPDTDKRVEAYSDDEVMFNAVWDRQHKDEQTILSHVSARLNRLMTLLQSVPLLNGSVKQKSKA